MDESDIIEIIAGHVWPKDVITAFVIASDVGYMKMLNAQAIKA